MIFGIIFWFAPLLPARASPQNPDLINSRLVINLPSRTLELFSGDRLVKAYPVAIGKPSTPTPTGSFYINYKEINPAWFPPERPGYMVPSGPDNPLGYRWMGFLPTYGVHGTNNPDSIGLVVSNGCIRMYEADVEELFELVPLYTPLLITYERVRVGIDKDNQAYITVFPDVYYRQNVTIETVREKLRPHGWNEWLDDNTIQRLIDECDEKPYVFMKFNNLLINGKYAVEKVLITPEGYLVPAEVIGEAVGAKLSYDSESGSVTVGSRSFPAVKKGQKLYAAPESINVLFGGSYTLNTAEHRLEAEILTLTLNQKPVTGDFPILAQTPLLPVLTVAEALEQKVFWDEKTSILVAAGKIVPVQVIRGKPYLPINKIYEIFNAYVYWDEAARTIDLTYPFQEPEGYEPSPASL